MENRGRYKTIVISDIHIGSRWSHTQAAIDFLSSNDCDMLVLGGDIIDGWHLGRNRRRWRHAYNGFLQLLLRTLETTEVVYIRGNHDDFLDNVTPFHYGNLSIVDNYIYESGDKRIFIFHGDMFDTVTARFRWLSKLGDKLYSMMLQVNRLYNDYRRRHGKSYLSISKVMKRKVKDMVSRASNFDNNIVSIAHRHGCNAVICGHIHQPDMRYIKDVLYMNSGDWIESLSALVEDENGNWKVLRLGDIL